MHNVLQTLVMVVPMVVDAMILIIVAVLIPRVA